MKYEPPILLELSEENMEWAKPKYSRKDVNWAGRCLVAVPTPPMNDFMHAVEIVDNFRACHAFPLNTLQNRLRILASDIDKKAIVAQRLKRLTSIMAKLQRF
jgi:hypothetical protein